MGDKIPVNIDIIFGLTGLILFIGASHYNYRLLMNFESDSRVASSMFFLKNSSTHTFRTVSILVFTVFLGETLILASNYLTSYASQLVIAGRISLIISMTAALYFVKSVNSITRNPSQAQDSSE